ncbi:uncharacterized protein K460DRAFT_279288 [Cucurbitaria berberidis CBS 394.84]|uniref:Uncharacterized protein n=1 Tax=Cucurbitaria berberidis CBS 394.84 TaxID=1168544 RepID=A0A9P4GM42_9PLEO|nr:uncharacterized protein K460DRAFT_279288 [Cucurbitaria berberidis CBS 394.84]KAF1848908.1 hypothetical protein K460DRAFT_279288 [Cucurbitaria berberidis CBS 394.84]
MKFADRVDIDCIWHIINMGDKYLFDGEILQGFFKRWYAANNNLDQKGVDFARQLALPCYVFDHAQGFADVTKWLAYNAEGHITEKRPPGFKWKHLHLAPPEFVGPMNASRGRLRNVLHKELWKSAETLMHRGKRSSTCTHWEKSFANYFYALYTADVYPIELKCARASINTMLSRLDEFYCPKGGCCSICTVDWEPAVEHAQTMTSKYFDGLCIDCMGNSRLPRGVDPDVKYWMKNGSSSGRWDQHCRIKHGEPTWYHSWCGRDEHRQRLIKAKNDDSD